MTESAADRSPPELATTEADDPLRWRLRLLASVDLIGSTAFKSATAEKGGVPEWPAVFEEFFDALPADVLAAYDDLTSEEIGPEPPPCAVCGGACREKLQTWKFAGDEILFQAEVHQHTEVLRHLRALKRASCGTGRRVAAWREKGYPLRLKASAWLAGFPVTNTELVLPILGKAASDNIATPKLRDFIGPSVDLGFRIGKFASARRFVLSADLAKMVIDAARRAKAQSNGAGKPFNLRYAGRESLKGVTGGEPYPIIWLDTEDGEEDPEEKLLGVPPAPEHSTLQKFLEPFLRDSPFLSIPFIASDEDPEYCTVPPDWAEAREKMRDGESERDNLTMNVPAEDQEDRPDAVQPPAPFAPPSRRDSSNEPPADGRARGGE